MSFEVLIPKLQPSVRSSVSYWTFKDPAYRKMKYKIWIERQIQIDGYDYFWNVKDISSSNASCEVEKIWLIDSCDHFTKHINDINGK